ncbi:protein phosphatase 2C domain-containing protein [Streptomyces sp. NPDC015184]|uniref:protein phosphatase 2C domain-containing protein n=1 Tax=Streptomyces sp. NPDC015184 TaxID=3364946 RepID=UPI0036F90803
MSQQGEKPAAHEDDWWHRLYDEDARDTGTGDAADTLDDRFDSASDAVGPDGRTGRGDVGEAEEARETGEAPSGAAPVVPPVPPGPSVLPAPPVPPAPSVPPDPPILRPERAPWEPPVTAVHSPDAPAADSPAGPSRPRTFAAPPPRVPVDPRASYPPPVMEPDPAAEPDLVTEPGSAPDQSVAPDRSIAPDRAAGPMDTGAPEPLPPLPRRPVAEQSATAPGTPAVPTAPAVPVVPQPGTASASRPAIGHVGDRPPTYDAEPTALPAATAEELDGLVADTVLDGARYGTYTLRAASVRGDSARFRGEPRRDALLTARFGDDEEALLLVAVATGARATRSAHLAAADACRWIGEAVGRSHGRLADDIRAGRRGDLKSGLNRLTDRTYGKLRARAGEQGLEPPEYTAGLRCLLLPADPDCRTRVFFGLGGGGLFRLRDGAWQDLEPLVAAAGDDPPAEPFRFRASVARPGDVLLLCSVGLAEPMRGEPALAGELAGRWARGGAPGLVPFLADTQLRVKGYSDDRTGAGVWEA